MLSGWLLEVQVPIRPRPLPELSERQIAKFRARHTAHPSGCWNWIAGRNERGYGRFRVGDRTLAAHRVAFAISRGADPGELFVCHSCDNPSCVNPDHLWLGTNADNLRDCVNKGRWPSALGPDARCRKCGHLRTDDYLSPDNRKPCIQRRCRNCVRIRDAKVIERRKANAPA